jgi:outer membrane protein assembly factor BamB
MSIHFVVTMHIGSRWFCKSILLSVIAGGLLACSSTTEKPKPTELMANVPLINMRLAWSAKVGAIDFPLEVASANRTDSPAITIASSDGALVNLDSSTGREVWRSNVGAPVTAGVGSDGLLSAVVTNANEVVVLNNERVIWRYTLNTAVYTSPLVAGGRVFVLGLDRSVNAFDGRTGRKLWVQKRSSESLILRQAGVLLAIDDTLVVGLSGRLVGLNPLDGNIRWEVPIATARGTNDVERMIDVIGRVSRERDIVCARAFRAAVGCVNTSNGSLVWSKPAAGSVGVYGDNRAVFGVENDGKIIAWNRSNGERLWSTDRLQYRNLTAPVVIGKSIAVADSTGQVHLLSREDGSPLTRFSTDGSAVVASTLVGNTLIVVTHNGGVFGFSPE